MGSRAGGTGLHPCRRLRRLLSRTEDEREMPRRPLAGLPELVRRRPIAEAWTDRTDADAPIRWRVSVYLTRAERSTTFERDWDAAIAVLAAAAGADGWDRELFDEYERERLEAASHVAPGEPYGWISTAPPAWRIVLNERASSRARAIEHARPRIGLPDGWTLSFDAEPARAAGRGRE
jgi:hypothetical protein